MRHLWKAAGAAILSILAVALIIVGCSDDDSGTNTPTPTRYTLTVNITPDNTGTVTLDPGQTSWLAGDTTVLTAEAESLYVFDHWAYFGADLTENPLTLTFDNSRNEVITAVFVDKQYSLTVNITPDLGGTVTQEPDQSSWISNDTVVLTAVADPLLVFSHWEYFGTDYTDNPFTLIFDGDRDEVITAVFVDRYTLTVHIEPADAGTVTLDPDWDTYAEGDTTLLTAVPNSGWAFDHWVYLSDDFFGNPVILTFEGDIHQEEITAVFIDDSQVVTLSGFAFRSGVDLVNPVLVLMDDTLAILEAFILEGGNDTAFFNVQFTPESVPSSFIHVVDDLDGDYTIFEAGEPYQCYDSDDIDTDCDFITYSAGQVISDMELELFVPPAAGEYPPMNIRPIKLNK